MRTTFFLLLLMSMCLSTSWAQVEAPRLVPFRSGSRWGYADQKRRLIIPLRYDEAGPFAEELAWVRQGSYYGYIDGSGATVAPPKFTYATIFDHGRALVAIGTDTFAIDPAGQRLPSSATPKPEEDYLEQGDIIRKNGKVGFRFTVGNTVVPAEYDEIRDTCNGLLLVRQGNKWGIMNSQGRVAHPLQLDSVRVAPGSPLLLVKQNNLYGYLDAAGRFVVKPRYQAAAPFAAGVARVTTTAGQTGYINDKGVEFFE